MCGGGAPSAGDAACPARRPRRTGARTRPVDAAADGPRAPSRRPRRRLRGAAPDRLERARLPVPGGGGGRRLSGGAHLVAVLALRAGVPPLAGALPAALRRPPVQRHDATAGRPAGVPGARLRRPGHPCRPGHPVGGVRERSGRGARALRRRALPARGAA